MIFQCEVRQQSDYSSREVIILHCKHQSVVFAFCEVCPIFYVLAEDIPYSHNCIHVFAHGYNRLVTGACFQIQSIMRRPFYAIEDIFEDSCFERDMYY